MTTKRMSAAESPTFHEQAKELGRICEQLRPGTGGAIEHFMRMAFDEGVASAQSRWEALGLLIRLIRKTVVDQENGCWNWTGAIKKEGGEYGQLITGSRKDGTRKISNPHRLSFEIFHGFIPKGHLICHTCDNPRCWNPLHLYAGDHQDNANDKVARNRLARMSGEWNPNAKLTWDQVREIRAAWPAKSAYQLAREYGVARNTIQGITSGRKWRDDGFQPSPDPKKENDHV